MIRQYLVEDSSGLWLELEHPEQEYWYSTIDYNIIINWRDLVTTKELI